MVAAEKSDPRDHQFHGQVRAGPHLPSPDPGAARSGFSLPLMVPDNTARFQTAFTVSIDAKEGITTGISAYDRARTILVAIDPEPSPSDLARPGHIFPLQAKEGGVLARAGQTEAAVDLARLAGLTPAGVICEIMNEDGTMARMPELEKLRPGARHSDPDDRRPDPIPDAQRNAWWPEGRGGRTCRRATAISGSSSSRTSSTTKTTSPWSKGEIRRDMPTLVRAHSQCLTGDTFGSLPMRLRRTAPPGHGHDRARRERASSFTS